MFLSPAQLYEQMQAQDPLCIVDLSKVEIYAAGHVPGACHLDETRMLRVAKPVGGLLPDEQSLSRLLSDLGIDVQTQVVAYDDQGNSRSARFIWTLEVLGHRLGAVLDGGLSAWQAVGQEVSQNICTATPGNPYPVQIRTDVQADKNWILEHLDDDDVVILDVRTEKEYQGEDVRSLRGGHVPGAISYNWLRSQDPERNRGLRPLHHLRSELEQLGVDPGKQIVVYCQTHMRSSHTFLLLRQLGYQRLRGYPGAWSDWGNDPGLPIEK